MVEGGKTMESACEICRRGRIADLFFFRERPDFRIKLTRAHFIREGRHGEIVRQAVQVW